MGAVIVTAGVTDLALRRGLRTGVVAIAGFVVGGWVLRSTDAAVFATFTGLAITGIADFGGTRCGRTTATLTAAGIGAVLTGLAPGLPPNRFRCRPR